jgi:hypothetical protein
MLNVLVKHLANTSKPEFGLSQHRQTIDFGGTDIQ